MKLDFPQVLAAVIGGVLIYTAIWGGTPVGVVKEALGRATQTTPKDKSTIPSKPASVPTVKDKNSLASNPNPPATRYK